MDHGGEAARLTTMESTNIGMAGAAVYHNSTVFTSHVRSVPVAVFHHEPGPGGAYANISEFRRQPGPVEVVLLSLQLPEGVVPVHDNYGYSAGLQPRSRSGAERGVVLAAQLPGGGGGGAVYIVDYVLQPRPGAEHGEVLVDLLPDGARHGEAFVGLLSGGVDAVYDNYGYYALQPRPGAGHSEVLVDPLPDGAGHGEVFVDRLSGVGVTVHNDYGYYPWQPRPGAGRGVVFIGPLNDGVGVVFHGLGNFAQENLPRADGIAGMLRDPNLGSGALADDLGAVYDDPGMAAAHLRRLLAFVGIGASSVAVNGLAAGPGSPAVAFHLFVLLLGGLFLVMLHVLGV